MKDRLKIAIIGAGIMGNLHARTYSTLHNIDLVAVCDIDKLNCEKLAGLYETKFYSDYKKLLLEESLDGVSITVPTLLHKEVALACIDQGINILIEKPLAGSVEEANQIVKAAYKKAVILGVGHIERFNPVIAKLKELIKEGIFGKVVSIVIKRVGLFPPRVKDVNVVTDLAVHDLDIVCNILGKLPHSIFATGGKGINATRVDYADIFLDFGETSCYLQTNWITPIKIRSLSLTGTLGYCELDYITQELTLYKSNYSGVVPQEFERFVKELGKPEKITVEIKKEEPLKLEIIDFIDAIIQKRQPLVTGEEGELAIKLSEIVLESLSNKKLIKL